MAAEDWISVDDVVDDAGIFGVASALMRRRPEERARIELSEDEAAEVLDELIKLSAELGLPCSP